MTDLTDKALSKEKFTVDNQISYMEEKGISFKFIDIEKAKSFLNNNSYYFKLTTFRKNYYKSKSGKYINLDFGNLNDLATIDMHFRYLIIQLTLDIEHSLKAKLMNLITNDPKEDGYSIVAEFDSYSETKHYYYNELKPEDERRDYRSIVKSIMDRDNQKYGYSDDLHTKRSSNPAVWVLIELMTYGELNRFVEFYVENEKLGFKSLNQSEKLLKATKKMRNAAAHSRAILINMTNSTSGIPIEVKNYAMKCNIDERNINKYFHNMKVNDFCAILILHETYVISNQTKRIRKKEMLKFIRRCKKNEHYYRLPSITHNNLKNILSLAFKLIDGYNK